MPVPGSITPSLGVPHQSPVLGLRGPHLADLPEGVGLEAGKDVAAGLCQDAEGHGAVVILQGRGVVVAHGQLGAGVDLVPGDGRGYSGHCPLGTPPEETPVDGPTNAACPLEDVGPCLVSLALFPTA